MVLIFIVMRLIEQVLLITHKLLVRVSSVLLVSLSYLGKKLIILVVLSLLKAFQVGTTPHTLMMSWGLSLATCT
jgi:hypothetical protein